MRSWFVLLLALVPLTNWADPGVIPLNPYKVVFAHMANTTHAVDWAMGLGANGVEMDLRFSRDNTPTVLQHSTVVTHPCDCSAGADASTWPDNICRGMGTLTPCTASTDAVTMMIHLAGHKDRLSVVYIDSKVDGSEGPPDLAVTGNNVIAFLDANLFKRGYLGQVIISVASVKEVAYLQGAVAAANLSQNKTQYYFTIDGQSSQPNLLPSSKVAAQEFERVMRELINLDTSNRLYSVGIAALAPGTYYDQISLSTFNKGQGVLAATGIWTIDKPDVMDKYIMFGVDSIITNVPTLALRAFADRKMPLAKPGQALTPTVSNNFFTTLPAGATCESNSNCANGACGRGTAADGAVKICCPSGQFGHFAGYDYCYEMLNGSVCWSDAMCASHYCKGNAYGLKKGRCT